MPIKPTIGLKNTEAPHKIFLEQFKINHSSLQNNKDDFNVLILSGLFLNLALESYITWAIEYLLEHVDRKKNRRITEIWKNHFRNSAFLDKKFKFFIDVFLSEEERQETEKIIAFIDRSKRLRNDIMHGHLFWTTSWSDGKVEKSDPAERLTAENIEDFYRGFEECTNRMYLLINKVEMKELTSGLTKEIIMTELKL